MITLDVASDERYAAMSVCLLKILYSGAERDTLTGSLSRPLRRNLP